MPMHLDEANIDTLLASDGKLFANKNLGLETKEIMVHFIPTLTNIA